MGGGAATAVLSKDDTVGGGQVPIMTGGTISTIRHLRRRYTAGPGRNRVVLQRRQYCKQYGASTGRRRLRQPCTVWSITIKNALITANTAAIQGGGIEYLPGGHGKSWHGCSCIRNTAGKSADDAAFCLSGTRRIPPASAYKMYGGGLVTWYRDTTIAAGDPTTALSGGATAMMQRTRVPRLSRLPVRPMATVSRLLSQRARHWLKPHRSRLWAHRRARRRCRHKRRSDHPG